MISGGDMMIGGVIKKKGKTGNPKQVNMISFVIVLKGGECLDVSINAKGGDC